jgi:Schlafen, AlbA_2
VSAELPVGRQEDLRLEFKGREALERPDSIAREVVALLNAEGGEVWVGVREDNGVAVEVEGVEEPERDRSRLRDVMVDLVEPAPMPEEVGIEIVGEDGKALRITVKPSAARRPYALRRGGRLEFPRRFMDRLQPMTRSELEEAFAGARSQPGTREPSAPSRAEQSLLDDQREVLAGGPPTFWLGIEPADASRRLDLERLFASRILENPRRSGNRWGGINFYLALKAVLFEPEVREAPRSGVRQGHRWLTLGGGSPFELALGEGGGLRSKVLLSDTPISFPPESEGSPFPELRKARSLNPKALLEYPASLFRLLRALKEHDLLEAPLGEMLAAVALVNVEGWYLRPGPDDPGWNYPFGLPLPRRELLRRPQAFADASFLGPPLRFSGDGIEQSPDACAFRLVSQVFAAFGWLDDEIPFFDRATAKLDFLP